MDEGFQSGIQPKFVLSNGNWETFVPSEKRLGVLLPTLDNLNSMLVHFKLSFRTFQDKPIIIRCPFTLQREERHYESKMFKTPKPWIKVKKYERVQRGSQDDKRKSLFRIYLYFIFTVLHYTDSCIQREFIQLSSGKYDNFYSKSTITRINYKGVDNAVAFSLQ